LAQSLPVSIEAVGEINCAGKGPCLNFDALVFVHGIYGDRDTFKHGKTKFDWPAQFPREISGRKIDVFKLNYETALWSWKKGTNPSFLAITEGADAILKPLRQRQYRSIGFIAHSLGGNIVSAYLNLVGSTGLPQHSQHAFVITLATPVRGAQIAKSAHWLKWFAGMSDLLLKSLEKDSINLEMQQAVRERIERGGKVQYRCRETTLHAAFEEKDMAFVNIAEQGSVVKPIKDFAKNIKGFPLDHSEIARPDGPKHPVAVWVTGLVEKEYRRLLDWRLDLGPSEDRPSYCHGMGFHPE
jgi:hypothetical protein